MEKRHAAHAALNLTALTAHGYHPPEPPTSADWVAVVAVLVLCAYLLVFCTLLLCRRRRGPVKDALVPNLCGYALAAAVHTVAVAVSNDHLDWTREVHVSACVLWEFWLQFCALAAVITLVLQRLYLYMVAILSAERQQGSRLYAMAPRQRNHLFALLFVGPFALACTAVWVADGSHPVVDTEPVTCYNTPGWKVVFAVLAAVEWLVFVGFVVYAWGSGTVRGRYRQYLDERGKALIVAVLAAAMVLVGAVLALANALTHADARVTWTTLLALFYGGTFTFLAGKILQRSYDHLAQRDRLRLRALGEHPGPKLPRHMDVLATDPAWMREFLTYCHERAAVERAVSDTEPLRETDLVYASAHNLARPVYASTLHVDAVDATRTEQRARRLHQEHLSVGELLLREHEAAARPVVQAGTGSGSGGVDLYHGAPAGTVATRSGGAQVSYAGLLQQHSSTEVVQVCAELRRRIDRGEPTTPHLLQLSEAVRRWRDIGQTSLWNRSPEIVRHRLDAVLRTLREPERALPVPWQHPSSTVGSAPDDGRYSTPEALPSPGVPLDEGYRRRLNTARDTEEPYDPTLCDPLLKQVITMLAQRYFDAFVTSDCSGAVQSLVRMHEEWQREVERRTQLAVDARYASDTEDDEAEEDAATLALMRSFETAGSRSTAQPPPPLTVAAVDAAASGRGSQTTEDPSDDDDDIPAKVE